RDRAAHPFAGCFGPGVVLRQAWRPVLDGPRVVGHQLGVVPCGARVAGEGASPGDAEVVFGVPGPVGAGGELERGEVVHGVGVVAAQCVRDEPDHAGFGGAVGGGAVVPPGGGSAPGLGGTFQAQQEGGGRGHHQIDSTLTPSGRAGGWDGSPGAHSAAPPLMGRSRCIPDRYWPSRSAAVRGMFSVMASSNTGGVKGGVSPTVATANAGATWEPVVCPLAPGTAHAAEATNRRSACLAASSRSSPARPEVAARLARSWWRSRAA